MKTHAAIISIVLLCALFITVNQMTRADPEGANVEYVSNTTKNATSPDSRNDSKGTITTLRLSTDQQNIKWKAYVGNVSGTLVLRDADDYSIFEWPSGGSPDGEVFMTRYSSVPNWGSIMCANYTSISGEESTLGHLSTSSDNINNTFSGQYHKEFDVGETTIQRSTCKSLVTWVNNTAQTLQESTENSTKFQEILLMDSGLNLIYATIIDQDSDSFKDPSTNTTYDFQAIVPDYTGAPVARYYFYVEISG